MEEKRLSISLNCNVTPGEGETQADYFKRQPSVRERLRNTT